MTVTLIDPAFLRTLKGQLDTLNTQVKAQLKGIGQNNLAGATWTIPAIGGDFGTQIEAGGVTFDAATDLQAALNAFGGSLQEKLQAFSKTLTDMSQEITDTLAKWTNNENLNTELASELITQFQGAISDMDSGSGSTTRPVNS